MVVESQAGDSKGEDVKKFAEAVIKNIEKVIVGKRTVIERLLIALLCEGHVLIEDAPGTGKTMLARALAISTGLDFKRVQCTPDLLPNDITGVSVFNQKTASSSSAPGRPSATSFWQMRLIGPRRAPRVPCWKPWVRPRSRSME